ncbi:hypothetical protein MCHI_000975 [Candidatus Magnetoovum chiemensis]|nr:hypothetical protein MCHI_000975 [Candidatus Magnetoovum chiemensis]
MKKYHDINNIRFEENFLVIEINGKESKFEFKNISHRLAQASEIQRNTFEISPSGYGIHWPLIDEDISIDGLLGIINNPKPDNTVYGLSKLS